jgi:hypothetical protein
MAKSMCRPCAPAVTGILGGFVLLVGVLSFVAVPAAQGKPSKITANGTIECSNSSGTMTFHPPLTPTGTAPETVSFVVTASDCWTSEKTNLPRGKVVGHVKATSSGGQNSYSTLGLSSSVTGTVGYSVKDATIVGTTMISGVQLTPESNGDLVSLPVPHMTNGSFAGVMVTSYANWTTSKIGASDKIGTGDIKKLRIVSGPEWW